MTEINQLSSNETQKTPSTDTGWFKPVDNASKCVICNVFLQQPVKFGRKLIKCPNCGSPLTPVKKIGLKILDDTAHIITDVD